MERLGIYGGTFSPPHNGHVHAAKCFLEQMALDRLIIVPTYIPPHKSRTDAVSAEMRFDMCKCAFGFSSQIEVSDMEIVRQGKSYTAETLGALTREGRKLFFLCGTDMLLTMDTWYKPEVIFALADIVCVRREEDVDVKTALDEKANEYRMRFGARIHLLTVPSLTLSSSEVRAQIKEGGAWEQLLPSEVAAYINEKELYQ